MCGLQVKCPSIFAESANLIGIPSVSCKCTQGPIVVANFYNSLFLTTNPTMGMEQDELIFANKCDMLYTYSSE